MRERRAKPEGYGGPVKARSNWTEWFVRSDGAPDAPVLVFEHLPKTAGTALRRVFRANLPPCDRIEDTRRLHLESRDRLLGLYREAYAGLGPERKAGLCCVMGHTANYVLPTLEREAQAITLVREPVDRVLSYHYFMQRTSLGGEVREPVPLGRVYGEWGGGVPPPGTGVLLPPDAYFNLQSRLLLAPHYEVSDLVYSYGPSDDADRWRERLISLVDSTYLTGVQDRFREFVEILATWYGWYPFRPTAKVNPHRPPLTETPAILVETIRGYNWLDAELYAHCWARMDAYGREQEAASGPESEAACS